VLRPSSSTSGGQLVWRGRVGGVVVVVVVVGVVADDVVEEEIWALVIAAQDAKEVQERQL
jgi:hypothetical protein